ncbi:DUF1203 domain-containing protein [Sphaerisporangium perillae]|uniref:DUF1203 domain-containing protein n=1 Tax=Sphaerisporangium perillae TaxID=2935860 RepID=UPI00200EB00F|nr:DUF1203 domain-containing protein [Sphaerisporangium perillae]
MTTHDTTIATFRVHPFPAEALECARAGEDASGNPPALIVAEGGEPLRCCLRDAEPGEELLLFGYEPPLPASPYREIGAVLAHARPCEGPAALDRYPAGWYGRPQVLRAYDARGWIHDATRVHDGQDPEGVIAAMLARPGVVEIHSRNVAYGCYMFTITRPDTPHEDA